MPEWNGKKKKTIRDNHIDLERKGNFLHLAKWRTLARVMGEQSNVIMQAKQSPQQEHINHGRTEEVETKLTGPGQCLRTLVAASPSQ